MNVNFFKGLSHRNKLLIMAGACVCLMIVFAVCFRAAGKEKGKEQPEPYTYQSAIERKLAEDVKAYLTIYFTQEEADMDAVAYEAVLCYRTILESGIESITDGHTDALNKKMRSVLEEHIPKEQVTYDDLEALANGVAGIILDTLLVQLEESSLSTMDAYREEYIALTESLQAQIDALNKKNTNINLTARIKNNKEEISKEVANEISNEMSRELYNTKEEIYNNMDEQLESIKEMLQNISDGKDGKTSYFAYAETAGGGGFSLTPTEKSKYIGICVTDTDTQPAASSAYSNWTLFVGRDGAAGQNGERGSTGAAGKNGKDGKNGTDGENGTDGKTTYFAYAEDTYGSGFSLRPTAKTKYIGTCVTDAAVQPSNASDYNNWQLITGQDGKDGMDGANGIDGTNGMDGVDGADGKTTYFAYAEDVYGSGFSLRPTAKTKYIGTCVTDAAVQPSNASDYNNWQLITGQDGKDGIDGINGKDGTDGKDGEKGEDGAAGADGKTTYIAYADNRLGDGFSLTPTETSKYIGTCITTESIQPASASAYSNWQLYRSYIITSTTDENNNTTLYIQ